jgi:hypothetical protein
MSEHDRVWATADGRGNCRYAFVEPLPGPGRVVWSRASPKDDTKAIENDRGLAAISASPRGIAIWRSGYALDVIEPETGTLIWDTKGGAPFPLTVASRALYVTTDFGVMGFVLAAGDVTQRDAAGRLDHTLFSNTDAKLERGRLRLIAIPDKLAALEVATGTEIALPQPFAAHEGPGSIRIGPAFAAIAGPLPFGQTEWDTDGPRLRMVPTEDRIWIEVGTRREHQFLVADREGRVLRSAKGSIRMADAHGALVDDEIRSLQLFSPAGEPLHAFHSCTPGAMSPEQVIVYETYDGPRKLMIRIVVFDRMTGERVEELPMGNLALAAEGVVYIAAGTRIIVHRPGAARREIDVGQAIVAHAAVDGGVIVRTERGDVIAIG